LLDELFTDLLELPDTDLLELLDDVPVDLLFVELPVDTERDEEELVLLDDVLVLLEEELVLLEEELVLLEEELPDTDLLEFSVDTERDEEEFLVSVETFLLLDMLLLPEDTLLLGDSVSILLVVTVLSGVEPFLLSVPFTCLLDLYVSTLLGLGSGLGGLGLRGGFTATGRERCLQS